MSPALNAALDATLNAADSRGAHRAALLVHGMGAEDRAWVLTRLPLEERAVVELLLRELKELGISSEVPAAALAPAAFQGASNQNSEAGSAPADGLDADRTDAVDPDRALVILAGSSPALAAAVLGCAAWPWRSGALARLDPAVRDAWNQRAGRPLPPALAMALRERFVGHVQALPAMPAMPVDGRGLFARLRSRLQTLLGQSNSTRDRTRSLSRCIP